MRPLLAVSSVLLATVAFAPTQLSAQTIAVYRDPYAVECPVIPQFGPTLVYLVATLEPAACGGITGAEFRLEGWPTAWFYIVQLGPGVPIDGDPFGDGARVHFGCQTSESGAVVVLAITVFATSPVTDVPVTVAAHRNPADPQFTCPVLKLCDAPVFTSLCATGVQTRINSNIAFCPCQGVCYGTCPPIGVEPNSWSGIKRLYD